MIVPNRVLVRRGARAATDHARLLTAKVVDLAVMVRLRTERAVERIDRFVVATRISTENGRRDAETMTISTLAAEDPGTAFLSVLAILENVVRPATAVNAVHEFAEMEIFELENVAASAVAPPRVMRDEAMDHAEIDVMEMPALANVPLDVRPTVTLDVEMALEVLAVTHVPVKVGTFVAILDPRETASRERVALVRRQPVRVNVGRQLVSPPRVKRLVARPKRARKVALARSGCATTPPSLLRRSRAKSERSPTRCPLILPQRFVDHLPGVPINASGSSHL